MKANLQGLRQQLRKFDENGWLVEGRHWTIFRGGYDKWFGIEYNNIPVLDCIAGRLQECAECKNYPAIAKIVLQEYPYLKQYNK